MVPKYTFRLNVFEEFKDVDRKGPSPRSGHRIVCNNDFLYVFGGYNPVENAEGTVHETSLLRQLYRFDFLKRKWKKLKCSGIPREAISSAATLFDPVVIIYGGTGLPFGRINSNKVLCIDLSARVLKMDELNCTGDVPLSMYGQSVAILNDVFYTVGGTSGLQFSLDVHKLDLRSKVWQHLVPIKDVEAFPPPRYRHEIAIFEGRIFVIGGGTSTDTYDFTKIPTFDISRRTWRMIDSFPDAETNAYPSKRYCHGCVQIPEDPVHIIVTGGTDTDVARTMHRDTWKLNLDSMRWTRLPSLDLPQGICFHSTYCTPDGRLLSFGGLTEDRERCAALYVAWIKIPKLKDVVWDAVVYYKNAGVKFPLSMVCGLPPHYREKLLTKSQLNLKFEPTE